MFRVTLVDKAGTPYSLDRPEQFLSKASVLRRQRQGLSLTLPISLCRRPISSESGRREEGLWQ